MLTPTVCTNIHVSVGAVTLEAHKERHVYNFLNMYQTAYVYAIARHLPDTDHEVDVEKSSKMINRQKCPILLKFAEAISIKRLKPDLCVQKEQVISLSLHW
uniref:Uncharacterized protein n=1 Tax=Trichobilharzia regenti TaxID=157069 RepID=A0AA85KHX2_TRIRE|nr:unnamed protein product [Trichobilharzia regenti]